jgi:protein TonB
LFSSLLNDIIFEKRNKAYGAYYLRANYHKNLLKALFISSISAIIVALLLLFFIQNKEEKVYSNINFKTENFSLTEVKIPKIVTEKKLVAKIEKHNLPPVVKEKVEEKIDNEVKKESPNEDSQKLGSTDSTVSKNGEATTGVSNDTSGTELYSQEIFMRVDVPAEFVGGTEAFSKFVMTNIKYPEYALKNKIDGIVYVHVVINTDGSLRDIKIYRGIEKSIDDEILRIIKLSPNWIPARKKGQNVRQRLIIPIKIQSPSADY